MASITTLQRRPAVRHPEGVRRFVLIDWGVVGLMVLAVIALALISPSLLTQLKFHYATTSGAFYEKLHPATYLVFAAFGLLLLRRGDPIGEIDRIASSARLLLVFAVCLGLLFMQCIIVRSPVTVVIDTFLLPGLFSVVVWHLTSAERKPLVWVFHGLIWVNIAVGYYEYFSGHRLIPLMVGNLLVTGDWRSTAFLGHPLAASSFIALYVLILIVRPELCRPLWLRIPAIVLSFGSLMAFGGRTALLSVLFVLACLILVTGFRLVRGARVALPAVMLAICAILLMSAAVLLLYEAGTFDKMIDRFSSDKGSAYARIASLHLLTLLDWKELLLGAEPTYGSSLRSMMGLRFGIESFWITYIVQFGVVGTAIITIGMGCFLAELLRRSDPAAWIAILYLVVDASSSVSFSSKGIALAQLIALIVIFMPREAQGVADPGPQKRGRPRRAALLAHAALR
ncbi:MAG TPA: VpsF family polysaccharide biosynthesis protein [Pseudolabrys sp.]|jgi:hypothetical protein